RRRIQRPDKFFQEESTMPEEVELVLTRPAGFEGLSDREVHELVRSEVARREALHREKGKARQMRGVFEQKWWECPESFDPRRKLRPTVAGKNKWARIEALQRAKEWLAAYYEALGRFVGGEREGEFPRGTWKMRVRLGCPVAAARASTGAGWRGSSGVWRRPCAGLTRAEIGDWTQLSGRGRRDRAGEARQCI